MDWMRRLAKHYERVRERYPGERLIVLFDIDGTILDMRSAATTPPTGPVTSPT